VTIRAAKLLDFDIGPVVERVVWGGRISYKMRHAIERRYHEPICYMVMRSRFDEYLTRKAQEAGAHLAEGVRVADVTMNGEGCTLRLADGSVSASVVIGADGANSVVAHSLDLMRDADMDVALEAEVEVSDQVLAAWDRRAAIDFGIVEPGYGWVFPKGRHLSIGVGGQKAGASAMRARYEAYLAALDLGAHRVVHFQGHHIPLRHDGSPIVRGRALLLGDAAGLADPFTGEGIYHAIRSARLAAPVVTDRLRGRASDLLAYEQAVAREIMPDLRLAATMMKAFFWTPGVYLRLVERLQRPWNATCRMLRGESDWVRIMDRTGPFRLLLKFLDR
jgi:geranylgeranyl reductase family protein